ncbi:hypothetical protein EQG49_04380 [Periweissella cryptocerci]|uniref:Uncharacterized protein n=1 Tax=Periweissella cryptocerci TaxID=2506420 RepID=A0A4P6YSX5_9LACO|nr:hypothetical protein [Periweissella cryptocerci]QBO35752.1 hypothetical protein EQG49_04380 [Periweissella cryptocerci]
MAAAKTLAILGRDEESFNEVVKKRFTDIANDVTAEQARPVIIALEEIWDLGELMSFNLIETYNHDLEV